jgi:hypothetical protein
VPQCLGAASEHFVAKTMCLCMQPDDDKALYLRLADEVYQQKELPLTPLETKPLPEKPLPEKPLPEKPLPSLPHPPPGQTPGEIGPVDPRYDLVLILCYVWLCGYSFPCICAVL